MTTEEGRARFATVVVPHLGDAFALARWLTGDRAAAEDVVQDACLRAFRAIEGYAGGDARAWVLTIVRNTAYSWLAKNRAVTLVAVDDLSNEDLAQIESGEQFVCESAATPESELIARSDFSRLEAAIAALPTEFRETLVLHDMQGLKYREIAEVTGAAIGTVMSRLARARQRLSRAIKAEET